MTADIAIYTLTSALHDEQAIAQETESFLGSIDINYCFRGSDYSDYGSHPLCLIYIRTGGTEGIFRQLLPQLLEKSRQPFYLLTSGKNNSLAASMEILSYLRQHQTKGEIIHGSRTYISQRISMLRQLSIARQRLHSMRLGIIGKPSDWLIASDVDYDIVKAKTGIELVDIPIQQLLAAIGGNAKEGIAGANHIYETLKTLLQQYQLQGFTLRCFDLLTSARSTGCLALAKLNAEGYIAGCEGDIPAMLTMAIAHSLFDISGFQANPASINTETGEMVFAHCTIPLNMVEHYELDTHFESGIGIGIRGYMKEGPVTIFKVSADLSNHFIAEGQLLRNEAEPSLCRTQQVILLSNSSQANYFLTRPIGNHHIILPGHHKNLLELLF
ncbi:MAG: hypothetical protein K5683_03080 [Prevotella sp.]|nr:hypothetical protein [Prevotella sp.]